MSPDYVRFLTVLCRISCSDNGPRTYIRQYEYDDPGAGFVIEGGTAGEVTQLHIGPDLSGDTPGVFPAPVADDGFVYHVFANEAFVTATDWQVFRLDDSGPYEERAADFSDVTDGIRVVSASESVNEVLLRYKSEPVTGLVLKDRSSSREILTQRRTTSDPMRYKLLEDRNYRREI